MIQVCSTQFNHIYNNKIHFPYSIACLVSQIKTKNNLASHFKFQKTFVFRDRFDEYISQNVECDILLCSCYVWNWEITTKFAKKIKEKNPNCLVIFGGPHVPLQSTGFFEKYPFVDIIVHGEGEHIITNIFEKYLENKNFEDVNGIETKQFKNPPENRIRDLNSIPSPYLSNLVWELVEKRKDIQWIASWETNRGCPYFCTFCDWGSATNTPMRSWSEERLIEEIEWFSENKIPYIDCCDANFGIYLERDMRLAQKLNEVSLKNKFPETFRPNWAKFSSEKIIPIAKELKQANLLRAVTLSVQSLDKDTLEIIKRQNIKFDKFSNLTESFDKNNIPTYSEVIMGLPGETLSSFKSGLETLATDTKIGSIQIYNCGMLPNAPMNDPAYREQYKIKTVKSPIDTVHANINNKGIDEYEEIVIQTSSYTFDELKKMYIYSWVFQTFHSLGLTEHIAKFYNKKYNFSYIKFYEGLIDFCKNENSLFSNEFNIMIKHRDIGYSGSGWNHYDPNLGDIYWPIEEATWLRIVLEKNRLIDTLKEFLMYFEKTNKINTDKMILDDLIKFQVFLLTTKNDQQEIKSENFNLDWKKYFTSEAELERKLKKYYYQNQIIEKDSSEWNCKVIWFGRFKKHFKFSVENLEENTVEMIKIQA